jgi:hypothetical protein
MRRTPTSILIGRNGRVVHHGFGLQTDMALGAIIALPLRADDPSEALVGPRWPGRSARELLARAREIADKTANRAPFKDKRSPVLRRR